MTKVEELREQLVRCTIDACLSCENSKDCESYACILTGHDEVDSNREIEHEKATAMAVQLVDSLIAAATAEGFAEGVEDTTANLTLVQDAEVFARGREEGAEVQAERDADRLADEAEASRQKEAEG